MQYRQRTANRPYVRKKHVFTPAEPASPQYAGHSAAIHPEDTPHVTTADVRAHLAPRQAYHAPDETEAGFHIYDIVKRYDGIPMPDGMLYRQGTDQVYVHHGPPPMRRASRGRETEEQSVQPPTSAPKPRRRVHWLFLVGFGLLIMLVGYLSLNAFTAWWQIHSDDGTYGRPRTFQIDAIVGHDDSETHPSHFIAINLNRHVSIIEFPGGQVVHVVIYSGPVLLGDGRDLTPATLTSSDVNGDGKVDMILHILDQSMVYLNNGTRFVPPSGVAQTGG